MALKLEERLEQAEKKLAELKALKSRADARKKAKDGKEKRRLDNKKKILLGAYLLDRMERDDESSHRVLKGLDGFLTRPADRDVFGLPQVPSPSAAAASPSGATDAN